MTEDFIFFDDADGLTDGEISLKLRETRPADPEREYVATYYFDICDKATGAKMGNCDLRIGHNEKLYYGGNIGYGVYPQFRGNRYAAKACWLLFTLAKRHDMGYVIITCTPENIPSRRTCEILGMTLLEIADLPEYNDMYIAGERQKCIYRIEI